MENKKVISKEQLNRALEVMKILGFNTPKEMNMQEPFTNNTNNQDKKNYWVIDKDILKIGCENNNHKYTWKIDLNDNQEVLIIDDWIYVKFWLEPSATATSGLFLHNKRKTWISTRFYSDICNVEVGENIIPIDDYFKAFVAYMRNKKDYLHKLIDDPRVIELIIKIFETPINNLIYDLKNNDQSWRLAYEEKKIFDRYNRDMKDNVLSYQNAIKNANERLTFTCQLTEETKTKRLNELSNIRQKYEQKQLKK